MNYQTITFQLILVIFVGGNAIAKPASNLSCVDLFEKHCSVLGACTSTTIVDGVIGDLQRLPDPIKAAENQNQVTLRELSDISAGEGLSLTDITDLYSRVENHPVASLAKVDDYDPHHLGTGFCFGRAMAAHLEALWNFKLLNPSIRKLWAIGELNSGKEKWAFHVTTIVKGTDGNWWAIDPIMGKPLRANDWIKEMQAKYDVHQTMTVFHTSAKQFGPAPPSFKTTNIEALTASEYYGYFVDLLKEYKRQRSLQKTR